MPNSKLPSRFARCHNECNFLVGPNPALQGPHDESGQGRAVQDPKARLGPLEQHWSHIGPIHNHRAVKRVGNQKRSGAPRTVTEPKQERHIEEDSDVRPRIGGSKQEPEQRSRYDESKDAKQNRNDKLNEVNVPLTSLEQKGRNSEKPSNDDQDKDDPVLGPRGRLHW